MLLKAAAIAAIAGLLLVALPSDQRRPYRTSEFRVPSRYRHEPARWTESTESRRWESNGTPTLAGTPSPSPCGKAAQGQHPLRQR